MSDAATVMHDATLAPKGPSREGYKRGCRCDGCLEAGQGYLAGKRARQQRAYAKRRALKEAGELQIRHHGIAGYQRGCRCSTCMADMLDARIARREKEIPPPDWSEVAHLMVGAGVRRRTA